MSGQSQNFWNFSVALYSQEGVSTACLELQNEFGFDINLILFCYWYGDSHGIFDDQLLQQAIQFSANWRQSVVQPLRNVRKWMKLNSSAFGPEQSSQYEILRERIKDDELAAEKYQQETMERLIQSSIPPETASTSGSKLAVTENSLKAAQANLEKMLSVLAGKTETKEEIERRLNLISSALYNKREGDAQA